MHPPNTLRNALRTASAVLTGVLAAFAIATPASAAPIGFSASDKGEDLCTVFETAGEADWFVMSIPEQPHVRLTGKTYTYIEGGPCLAVVPKDRHVQFTGFDRDGKPVAELAIPIPTGEATAYDTSIVPANGTSIAYLAVAVCVSGPVIGKDLDCGETQYVYPEPWIGG